MKTIFYIIILFFFSITNVFAQEDFKYNLIGVLLLENNVSYAYRLSFNINNKKISGVSYTDLGGKDETKSRIKGSFNPNDKSFSFKEYAIDYTKSEIKDFSSFCYLSASGKFKVNNKRRMLKGDLYGIYKGKDTCAKGDIILLSDVFVNKKINKIYKKVSKKKKLADTIKEVFNPDKFKDMSKASILNAGETINYASENDYIYLFVWDRQKEDGDNVTVFVNDKIVVDNLSITNDKYRLKIDLKKGKNEIKIRANNEGELPPNTADIRVDVLNNRHHLSTKLNVNETASIIIYRE
ncbi:MAG: hypothetical protein CR968_05165 [Flavobacteriia bacterium]|nr:MAG: hypothetical protein CR968_05165 [Flavobacteriia bacterium]